MADPATWIVLSTAAQVGGNIMAGRAQASRTRYDAQVLEDNARLRVQQANAEANAMRRQSAVEFSKAKARAASAGIQFTGTPLQVAAQNAAMDEYEARLALYAGHTELVAAREQSIQMRRTARAQLISTAISSAGQLAQGAASFRLASQTQAMRTTPVPSPTGTTGAT